MTDRTSHFKTALRGIAGVAVVALLWLAQSGVQIAATLFLVSIWALSLIVDVIVARRDSAARSDAQATAAALLQGDAKALDRHAMVVRTDTSGRIDFVNDQFLELTGYTPQDLIGRSPCAYGHPDEAHICDDIARTTAAGQIWTGRQRVVGKAGEVFVTQSSNVPRLDQRRRSHGVLSVHSDVTSAATAVVPTAAAAPVPDTVRSLHLLSEPVFMVLAETHEVVFANDAALALFGWTRSRLSDASMAAVALACDRRAVLRQIAALEAGKIEHFTFEATYNDFSFEAEVQMIASEDIGRRLYVVLRDQAQQLEVARARNELVATVSHELRTPLTSIKGALGLVRSGAAGEMSDRIAGLLDIAYRNADRLVLIVNDILDLEKLAAGQMDYFMECQDLNRTMREAVAANDAFAARFGVTIRTKSDIEPAWVVHDADRIHQVLTNLISNACKFSPDGAQIDVSLTEVADGFEIRVVDRGDGIPASALERIFDRFTQVGKSARARKGGTGLGLSIVKGIVESHGGTIRLDSVEGQGTTAIVTFARAATPAEQTVAALGGR